MCAQSIEKKLSQLEFVKSAAVNFTLGKISLSTEREEGVFDEVKKVVTAVEADAILSEIGHATASKKEHKWFKDWFFWCFILGAVIGTVGIVFEHTNFVLSIVLICIGAALMLIKTANRAVLKAIRAHSIDENLLVSISVIGAIAIGEGMEGLMVIFLYQIGKFLEAMAVAKSHRDINSLLKVKPETVRLQTADGLVEVSPSAVPIGSTISVFAGDIVALDGIVMSGNSSLDMSSLTGESAPVAVFEGENIMSGSVNLDGVLTIKTTSTDSDSTITKIMQLVETAAERKAKTETIVSKAARYYTPAVIFIAIFVGLMFYFFSNVGTKESIYRGMIFLVISCPCAIAISVPLSYFSGIGNASKKGILIKGSNYIDAVANMKAVVFDKTGTLTTGEFEFVKIETYDNDFDEDKILRLAVIGERNSTHPIAKAIVAHYENVTQNRADEMKPQEIKEIAGRGLSYKLNKDLIFIGRGVSESDKTAVDVNINGKVAGRIFLSDKVKDGAKETVQYMKDSKLDTYMFTGDNKAVAQSVAKQVGIDNVFSEMLPKDKYEKLEGLLGKGGNVAFVGDGINDSPVLTRADIGIAMGLNGATATIDTADIVLMNDDLKKLPALHKLSKFTKRIVMQNLIFALGVKLMFMILGTAGITGMAWAVVADVGLTLLTIFNSLRVLNMK